MAGAWKGGLALSNATSIGAVTGTSSGTLVAGSASTFTKGPWAQLIASTTSDIAWVSVYSELITTGSSGTALDIGIGGSGSEIVVVPDLNLTYGSSYFFPLSIASGSRVAARFSGSIGNTSVPVLLQGFEDTYQSAGVGSAIDALGYSSSLNQGTAVDSGAAANTKGAYSQIIASTVADYAGFFMAFDSQTATGTIGSVQWLIDLAVGSAGSEVVILPNRYQIAFTLNTPWNMFIPAPFFLPIPIAAGSRIAARAQCSTNASPDRVIGITVYGVRQ